MAGSGNITAAPPPEGAPPAGPPADTAKAAAGKDPTRRRRWMIAIGFLAPAVFFLGLWVVYPTVYTFVRSLFDRTGENFVGIDNFKEIFTTSILLTAIRNNAIWVLVVPAVVTAIGLVFAVLTERVRWGIAFKTAIFMPMAISLFAAGVIWRVMYEKDPDRGTVNAAISGVRDVFTSGGVLTRGQPSTDMFEGTRNTGFTLKEPVQPGDTVTLGLTGIPVREIPEGASQAVEPQPEEGGITGVVWRDFSPGGGEAGSVEQDELGLPGVKLVLRNQTNETVAETEAAQDGSFRFSDVAQGTYTVAISRDTFAERFGGVSWLGSRLITPAIIIAYIWVWAGFAMVVVGAGLAAIPRDVLEAARTDGANEWQVFRRVTIPLLAPTLSVVFITMMINVLKIFDIVLSVAPASVQDDANVIALAMWRTSFGGVSDFGLGSAIAVFLFILVVPVLLLNIRRFRREA